jgi:hypothetical protein
MRAMSADARPEPAMIGWLAHVRALAGLTLIDAARQRLWLLFLAAVAVLVGSAPGLSAVDESARLKLAVVAITGAIGFVVVLLAILVAAMALRRDLDARIGYLLFSKPLRLSAYLGGRWLGVQLGLLVGIVALALVGSGTIAWQFGGTPAMRALSHPQAWEQVGAFGQRSAIDERRTRVTLSGTPGNGVRWRFTGLPVASLPAEGMELLLKVGIRSYDQDNPIEDSLGQVTAQPAIADGEAAVSILALDPASPYGHARAGTTVPAGQVVLRDRDETRDDLSQDFLRLRVPRAAIAADGGVVIQLTRLEGRSALVVTRQGSAQLAVPGGSFLGNLVRGGLVLLASASLLTAFTLGIAAVTNLGVAALGGLTLYFAGSATAAMREVAGAHDTGTALRRVVTLALDVLPDFDRFSVAARLAASESVGWDMVAQAWVYFGAYAVGFLVLAWVAMRRNEL